MKYAFSVVAFLAGLTIADASHAASMNTGAQTYSGTGQTRGYTSGTGFVKERNDEQDHMDGKTDESDESESKDDGDLPADSGKDNSKGN